MTDDTPATPSPPPLREQAVLGWNVAFSVGACAASYALVSPRFAGSVAVGSAIELMNFRGLFRHARMTLLGEPVSGAALGAFGFRFVLLAVALYLSLSAGLHPVGLVLGLSLILPAVVIAAWRVRPQDDPNAVALPEDDPSWDAWNPWLARESDADDDDDEEEKA